MYLPGSFIQEELIILVSTNSPHMRNCLLAVEQHWIHRISSTHIIETTITRYMVDLRVLWPFLSAIISLQLFICLNINFGHSVIVDFHSLGFS